MMYDPRIGRITDDAVIFPNTTVTGEAYQRPAATRNLVDGFFVVLPSSGIIPETIYAELLALVDPNAPPLAPSPRKKG